jgi:hypothetical protein
MLTLLVDERARAFRSRSAIEHARACSFEGVAEAYLDAVGLS